MNVDFLRTRLQKRSKIRSFILFFLENNKIIKLLKVVGFEKLIKVYLWKSDRSLFIQRKNVESVANPARG